MTFDTQSSADVGRSLVAVHSAGLVLKLVGVGLCCTLTDSDAGLWQRLVVVVFYKSHLSGPTVYRHDYWFVG